MTRPPTKTQQTIMMHIVQNWKITSKPFSLHSAAQAMSRRRSPLNSALHSGHRGLAAVSLRCCGPTAQPPQAGGSELLLRGEGVVRRHLVLLDEALQALDVHEARLVLLVAGARRKHVLPTSTARSAAARQLQEAGRAGAGGIGRLSHLGLVLPVAHAAFQPRRPRRARRRSGLTRLRLRSPRRPRAADAHPQRS